MDASRLNLPAGKQNMTTREFCAALPADTRQTLRNWEREVTQVASTVARRGGDQREARDAESEGVYAHAMERSEAEALLLLHGHHTPPHCAFGGRFAVTYCVDSAVYTCLHAICTLSARCLHAVCTLSAHLL
jgi:hypothetical protein